MIDRRVLLFLSPEAIAVAQDFDLLKTVRPAAARALAQSMRALRQRVRERPEDARVLKPRRFVI